MPRQRSSSSLPHLEDSKEIGHPFSTTHHWSWQRIACLWDDRQTELVRRSRVKNGNHTAAIATVQKATPSKIKERVKTRNQLKSLLKWGLRRWLGLVICFGFCDPMPASVVYAQNKGKGGCKASLYGV
ncbi:hypothetical protein I7I53_07013 [Histoplasma capsulatum var. duboisii H88]|uniref:Uncharacterized protein n=1 Tax=Ajellomyces capsulatus (strain H88) TaxID=544711 RepID=A0A8A1LFH7_AJEC8|nr:hypothetical protein I7I53_07013 [Histoplasma capsulatum var. duboisii H88]